MPRKRHLPNTAKEPVASFELLAKKLRRCATYAIEHCEIIDPKIFARLSREIFREMFDQMDDDNGEEKENENTTDIEIDFNYYGDATSERRTTAR